MPSAAAVHDQLALFRSLLGVSNQLFGAVVRMHQRVWPVCVNTVYSTYLCSILLLNTSVASPAESLLKSSPHVGALPYLDRSIPADAAHNLVVSDLAAPQNCKTCQQYKEQEGHSWLHQGRVVVSAVMLYQQLEVAATESAMLITGQPHFKVTEQDCLAGSAVRGQ